MRYYVHTSLRVEVEFHIIFTYRGILFFFFFSHDAQSRAARKQGVGWVWVWLQAVVD